MAGLKFKLGQRVASKLYGEVEIISIDTRDVSLPYRVSNGKESGWVRQSQLSEIKVASKKPDVYVRRFESGAVRSDDRGRENPSFISPYALKFLAEHFSANAAFFNSDSAKNYMKGIEPKDIEGSMSRHYLDFCFAMMPNRRHDTKAIKKAMVELMANCVMGLHQIGLEEDGQYVKIHDKVEYIKKED